MRKKMLIFILVAAVTIAGSGIAWYIFSEGFFKKNPVKAKQVFLNTGISYSVQMVENNFGFLEHNNYSHCT